MPHAAPRVGHVARIPRDHVDMHVRHRLPGSLACVEPDVVAIRLRVQPLVEQLLDLVDELHQRLLLGGRAIKPRRYDPPRDHEHMPGRHRKRIEDRESEVVRAEPPRFGISKKRRVAVVHRQFYTVACKA